MSAEPPPLYTKSEAEGGPSSSEDANAEPDDPQILIVPPSQSAQFQKGFLGAEDERAAIEGELQIKGISASACRKVLVHLLTLSHVCQLKDSQNSFSAKRRDGVWSRSRAIHVRGRVIFADNGRGICTLIIPVCYPSYTRYATMSEFDEILYRTHPHGQRTPHFRSTTGVIEKYSCATAKIYLA